MKHLSSIQSVLAVATITLTLTPMIQAREKPVYQTTKLMELKRAGGHWGHEGFCFVVQIDDLAYVAFTDDDLPRNLIVGDPIQLRIKGDHIWVRTDKKWPDDEVKTKITVRERMTGDAKLPTCSLSVVVH